MAKFNLNPKLFDYLKNTGQKALVECNAHDTVWGNGVSLYSKDPTKGAGQNKLGICLQQVRDSL